MKSRYSSRIALIRSAFDPYNKKVECVYSISNVYTALLLHMLLIASGTKHPKTDCEDKGGKCVFTWWPDEPSRPCGFAVSRRCFLLKGLITGFSRPRMGWRTTMSSHERVNNKNGRERPRVWGGGLEKDTGRNKGIKASAAFGTSLLMCSEALMCRAWVQSLSFWLTSLRSF